ncbi:60 kDa lysophospholipase-like [Protobothrops mucrosquamatus]|uniref:60 kDa lysophospholipase-like n=1 Tax=Protobothrops mucrosquamatus TaxID=103944 RepID=UPI000775D6E8|nr:60 kDa lysophospholipase-like [Protobothrops mucrosquamatus]
MKEAIRHLLKIQTIEPATILSKELYHSASHRPPEKRRSAFWAERTLVHKAARTRDIHQLQELIRNGACVNLVTYDSITPLHEASLRGQTRCVEILLAAGAQVDARNIDGSTPFCDACASEPPCGSLSFVVSDSVTLSAEKPWKRFPHLHIPTKFVEFLSYSQ